MNNEVLYLLLPDFAAHEIVYLSEAIACDERSIKVNPKFINRIVAPTMEAVRSCDGFRLLPDYSFDTMPDDYAALVLIGGFGWLDASVADRVAPIVRLAIGSGRIVGGICNAASFLARHGFLNDIRHTGNGLDQLKLWGGEHYTNEGMYVNEQAVSDHRVVTANGSATLEFARELLLLLENGDARTIEMYYQFHKHGFVELFSKK